MNSFVPQLAEGTDRVVTRRWRTPGTCRRLRIKLHVSPLCISISANVKIPRQVKFKFKSTLVGSPSAISIDSRPPLQWLPEHIRYIDIRTCMLIVCCLPALVVCLFLCRLDQGLDLSSQLALKVDTLHKKHPTGEVLEER